MNLKIVQFFIQFNSITIKIPSNVFDISTFVRQIFKFTNTRKNYLFLKYDNNNNALFVLIVGSIFIFKWFFNYLFKMIFAFCFFKVYLNECCDTEMILFYCSITNNFLNLHIRRHCLSSTFVYLDFLVESLLFWWQSDNINCKSKNFSKSNNLI